MSTIPNQITRLSPCYSLFRSQHKDVVKTLVTNNKRDKLFHLVQDWVNKYENSFAPWLLYKERTSTLENYWVGYVQFTFTDEIPRYLYRPDVTSYVYTRCLKTYLNQKQVARANEIVEYFAPLFDSVLDALKVKRTAELIELGAYLFELITAAQYGVVPKEINAATYQVRMYQEIEQYLESCV